jgi:hypothetical protein
MGVNMMEICTYIWKLISLLSVYGFHWKGPWSPSWNLVKCSLLFLKLLLMELFPWFLSQSVCYWIIGRLPTSVH